MNKVVFISDFFVDEHLGGAELSDASLIFHIAKKIEVLKVKSLDFDFKIHKGEFFIISNFWLLPKKQKDFFIDNNINYIIIERDQKYVKSRNTAEYPYFIAPSQEVVNRDFYLNAKTVFCLTSKQLEIMNQHLNLSNARSLGVTHFSTSDLSVLLRNINNKKNDKYAIVKGKRWDKALALCQRENINYEIIEKCDYNIFINKLSKYKGLVFFSHAFESCCRLLIEARILNLSVITDDRNGCTYEDWFKNKKGEQLYRFISQKTVSSMEEIYQEIHL